MELIDEQKKKRSNVRDYRLFAQAVQTSLAPRFREIAHMQRLPFENSAYGRVVFVSCFFCMLVECVLCAVVWPYVVSLTGFWWLKIRCQD